MPIKPKIVMFNPQASPKMPYDGPPLSVLAAACMIDLNRFDVRIIDWHYPDFSKLLQSECRNAMVFGVTCMSGHQIGRMLEAIELVKTANPDIKVVCGGWHPTFLPEQTLGCEQVDYVVMGQGQRTFKNLVDCIQNGTLPDKVKGVAYRKNGQVILNEWPAIESMDNFPPFPYHLLDNYEDFLIHTSFGDRTAYFITSQGCPNNCYFCAEAAFYKRRWYPLPLDRVMAEIVQMKDKYNIDSVMIADANFFANEKRLAEFCRRMIPLGLRWGGTGSRSDLLAKYSDETWKLMSQSGLYDIFIGLESASDETLRIMNKGCKVADTLAVLPKARKYGIRIQCPFIIGAPGVDVEKDFKADMELINKLRKSGDVAQFHMFVCIPYPGTAFLEKAIELGYKPPETLLDWGQYDLHANVVPWVPAKYAEITDQLSVYFMFLAGHARRVIETSMPSSIRWLGLVAERIVHRLSDLRVTYSFFSMPVEYRLIKFALMHRQWLFGKKKILF